MKFDVWMEGYAVTGNRDTARLLGSAEAEAFAEACRVVCAKESDFNPKTLSIWGCRLFDNESDARRSFG